MITEESTLNAIERIRDLDNAIINLSTAMADILKVVAKIEKKMAERSRTGLDIQEIS